MDVFKLSRTWFDFCFENPEKVKPNHSALYFFCIEHCNRLGWKSKFGLPTTMAKEAIGISSYNTYISTLNDLIAWGFITLIEKSKNQYSSNIIALSNYNKALDKALDKALIKHATKQSESTVQSTDSIDIQETINKKQETIEARAELFYNEISLHLSDYSKEMLRKFYNYWSEPNKKKTKMRFELQQTWDLSRRLKTWSERESKSKVNIMSNPELKF